VDEPKRHRGRSIKRKKSPQNQYNNQNGLPEGTPVSTRGIEAGSRTETTPNNPASSSLGEGTGRDVDRSGVEAQGLHAERRVLESEASGRRGTSQVGHGVEDSQSLHAESSARSSGESGANANRPSSASDTNLNATGGGPNNAELKQLIEKLRDPIYFARAYCLKRIDEWQARFLAECKSPGLIALRGANGIGKTVIICVITLFFLSTVKNCRVVIVSGVFRQLKMFVEHLQSLLKNFPGWEIKRSAHELHSPFPENKAIWFATDSPGAAQGQHSVVEAVDLDDWGLNEEDLNAKLTQVAKEAKESKSCLILIRDECHVITRGVKENTDTYGADWTFDLSYPGVADGWFHEIFSKLSHIYRCHKVTAFDSSYVKPEQIEKMRETHGENSPMYKSSVLAEFSDVGTVNVVTVDMWDACAKSPPTWEKGHPSERVGGLDLSAAKKGGDKCVLYHRDGNKIFEPVKYTNYASEMDLLARILVDIKLLQIKCIFADKGGLGSPMISLLEKVIIDEGATVRIHRVDFGGKPVSTTNPHKCKNRATELMYLLAERLTLKRLILPKDTETRQQAIQRQIEPMPDLSVRLQSKSELSKSPDELDALLLCLPDAPADTSHTLKTRQWYDESDVKNIHSRKVNGVGMVGGKYLGRG
jgi:hypothetical protein